MQTFLNITLIILLLALVYLSITNRMEINKLKGNGNGTVVVKKNTNGSNNEVARDILASELADAYREKLKSQEVSELTVKFNQ